MSDFGELIFSYTRAQALEDGVLVDVTESSACRGSGYRYPVALTIALHSDLTVGQGKSPETFDARLWDVLWMSSQAGKRVDGSDVYFRVKVGRRVLRLRANCGPGDNHEPVITIGYPEDF